MSQGFERYAKEGLLLGAVVVNNLEELKDSPIYPWVTSSLWSLLIPKQSNPSAEAWRTPGRKWSGLM